MSEESNTGFPPPPPSLLSRSPLRWFAFFGPGAIIASVNIGSGEIFFPSRTGSVFGYRILWVLLLIALLKWVLVYTSMRHMILTGGHPCRRWSSIPGPPGWMNLFMVAVAFVCSPLWLCFLEGVLGTVCTWIFGVGTLHAWASLWVAVAILLLAVGGYRFLEKAQMAILGVTVSCILVAVFHVRPDWLQVIQGFLVPVALTYPEWLARELPEMAARSPWLEIMVYAAALGGQSYDYLAYVSFLREKKWGHSDGGPVTPARLAHAAARPDDPARLWVRAAVIDTVVSFAMIVLVAACFSILGTVLLQPHYLVPDGVNLLNYQATFLTTLSPLLLPLYKIGVFFAFFGILYGGPEVTYRLFYEFGLTLGKSRSELDNSRLRWATILWILLGGLSILWLTRLFPQVDLLDIVTPAGIYTGVLLCGFYCLANIWSDWKFLPRELRMPRFLMAANLVAGLAFTGMGLKAIWDYDQIRGFVILAALLLGSMLVASRWKRIRPISEPQ